MEAWSARWIVLLASTRHLLCVDRRQRRRRRACQAAHAVHPAGCDGSGLVVASRHAISMTFRLMKPGAGLASGPGPAGERLWQFRIVDSQFAETICRLGRGGQMSDRFHCDRCSGGPASAGMDLFGTSVRRCCRMGNHRHGFWTVARRRHSFAGLETFKPWFNGYFGRGAFRLSVGCAAGIYCFRDFSGAW